MKRVAAFACAALVSLGAVASADPVFAGDSIFSIVPGQQSYFDFAILPIPADFFAPGSQPFGGLVMIWGEPFGPTPFGFFDNEDTLVTRGPDPFERSALPPTDQSVPIEIVALNLKSIQPIQVDFSGGSSEFWYVGMTLQPSLPGTGQLQIRQQTLDGGHFQGQFFVQPQFVFVRKQDVDAAALGLIAPGSINVRVLDLGTFGMLTPAPVPWSFLSPFSPGVVGFFPGVNSPPAPFLWMDGRGGFSLLVLLTGPPGRGGAPVPEPATLLCTALALAGWALVHVRARVSSRA